MRTNDELLKRGNGNKRLTINIFNMTMQELKEASSRRELVKYEGNEYICVGVQVLYRQNERLVSACLQDKQNRLLWAKMEKVERISKTS